MDSVNSNRLKPLGSLQLMAVIMVVIVHFGRSDCFFMGVHWMTFCFIYSGFFTAMHHRFGPGYSLRDHGRFMWKKVAKLYPLHLLASCGALSLPGSCGMSTPSTSKHCWPS